MGRLIESWIVVGMLALSVNCVLPPLSTPSILINPSNQYEKATYTFSFTFEQSIGQAATVEIEFPTEYSWSDLASANCTMVGLVCSLPYYNGLNASTLYQVSLGNIVNPSAGGVGNFQIRSKIGQNIIEESRIFSNAGLRGTVDSFLYIELSSDNAIAGTSANYSLRFKTRQSYPYGVYFEMSMGSAYNITTLSQQYATIDSNQQYVIGFGMRNPYSVDALADLPAKLFKGTYQLVKGQVKNPLFSAAPLQCSMTVAFFISSNSQYKVVDYDFSVLPLYPPIIASQLEIIVPEYFARYNSGFQNTLFYYAYDGNQLQFMGDRVYNMAILNSTKQMRYRLRLRNPYVIGTTSPFRLSLRYQGGLYMYDQSTCLTTITSPAPADLVRPLTAMSTNSTVGALTNVTLSVPAVPGANTLQFQFGPEWSISQSNLIAIVSSGYAVLNTKLEGGQLVTVVLDRNITTALTISLCGGINNPMRNGSYLVEVVSGNMSYTDIVVVHSEDSSASTTISAVGNMVTVQFVSTGIAQGYISVDYSSGANFGLKPDCTINSHKHNCIFITNTRVQLTNLTLEGGTTYTLMVSGVAVNGASSFTFQEYVTLPDVGAVETRQVSSQIVTALASATIDCGLLNVHLDVAVDVLISSCLTLPNPTTLLVTSDQAVNTLASGLLLDGSTQQTSNPLYSKSIAVTTGIPSSFSNLTLTQVKPSSSPATSTLNLYLSNSSTTVRYYYTLNISLPNQLPLSLQLSSSAKQDVGVVYNFTVTPLADTPVGSLVISFPRSYSLNESAAWAISNFSGYTQASVESTRVIVNGVQLKAGGCYMVSVFGVINPSANKVTGFDVQFVQYTPEQVVFAGNTNTRSASFTSKLLKSALSVAVDFYPQNALTVADYTITITVPRTVPAKSQLQLNFPGEFATLGSPICRLRYIGYGSCNIVSNLTIQILLSGSIAADTPIVLVISNISNPFQGTINPFYVSVSCSGQTIAQGYSLPLQILQSCETKTLVQWSVSPSTAGQQAQYTFEYLPNYDISYQDTLFVRFPYEFDSSLGPGLTCLFTNALKIESRVSCQQSHPMEIEIYVGQYSVYSGTSLTIKIVGVVNVNIATGSLMIGVKRLQSLYYTESAITLTGVTPSKAADVLTFNQLSASNNNIRLAGTYTVQFYSALPISCSTMSIFVVFPNYIYALPINKTLVCSSPSFEVACSVGYNNRIEVSPVGVQKIEAGLTHIVLFGVDNPIDESTVSAYHVEIFDHLNKLVVGRTYSNLEFYSMQFVALGPYIKFNNQQSISMNQGTTVDIPVIVTQPLILQIKSKGFGPFAFDPYLLVLQPGTTSASVRISSPKGQTGTFTINWQISGDLTPLYYTPVKQTTVHIRGVLTSVSLAPLQSPLLVPIGGCSGLVLVNLEYPPDTNIVVDVYDNSSSPITSLQYLRNETTKSFVICNRTSNGTLNFVLSGINLPNYQLLNSTLGYQVGSVLQPVPTVTVLDVYSVSKTQVYVNISLDISASVLLLLSLNNSALPQLLNQSILSTGISEQFPISTRTIYSSFLYTDPNANKSVMLAGINANTSYQTSLYILLTNATYQLLKTISFWSQPFDPVCQLTFTFGSALSTTDKWAFSQSVSYVLGVPVSSVVFNPQYSSQTTVKLILGQQQNASDQSPSPLNMSKNLYIRPTRLQSRLKSLILENPYLSEVGAITTIPAITSIYLSSYNIDMLSFVVEVSVPGSLYGVLILSNQSTAQPTAQQVYFGLGTLNLEPAKKYTKTPCLAGPNSFLFEGLSAFEQYKVCVMVGNLDPTPTLNSTVLCLSSQTNYPPSHITLRIKWASRLAVALTVALMIIL